MKLIALASLLVISCSTTQTAVRFTPEEAFKEKGPLFVCMRGDDKKSLDCLDLAEFLESIKRHERDHAPEVTDL